MRKNHTKHISKKGFTLIELIIVFAILAVLAAIAIPKVTNALETAKVQADQVNAKLVADAANMAMYQGDIVKNGSDYKSTGGTILNYTDAPVEVGATGDSIQLHLRALPKPEKAAGFYIKIDTDGNITVFGDSSGTNKLYPQN